MCAIDKQRKQAAVLEHTAALQYRKVTVKAELQREYAARPLKLSQPVDKEEKSDIAVDRAEEAGTSAWIRCDDLGTEHAQRNP